MGAKKHTIDYNEIGRALRRFCFNANDMSEDGPYGKTAKSLGWSNSRKNRKYLKLMWCSNRGNVQNLEEGEDNQMVYLKTEATKVMIYYIWMGKVLPRSRKTKKIRL